MMTLFHAFNWQLADISAHIPQLRKLGFDGVQTSPLQQCMSDSREWFFRYQPFDFSKISGLGTEEDLRTLCECATNAGMFVVADLVFNHMGPVSTAAESRSAWTKAQAGDPTEQRQIEQRLHRFPQFTPDDFHPLRPIGGHEYDDDALRLTGWGGDGTWPDLKPTPTVLRAQTEHIDTLYQLGVRGFRFDAVKQMFCDSQYKLLVDHCRQHEDIQLIYGEVLSTDPRMCESYSEVACSTDFLMTRALVEAFEEKRNLSQLQSPAQLPHKSLRFARNHDTTFQHLPQLSFSDRCLAALAGVYLLGRPQDSVLVLDEDLKDPLFCKLTERALQHRNHLQSLGAETAQIETPVRKSGDQLPQALWLNHGRAGGIFLNSSDEALSLGETHVHHFDADGLYECQTSKTAEEVKASGCQTFGNCFSGLYCPPRDAVFIRLVS